MASDIHEVVRVLLDGGASVDSHHPLSAESKCDAKTIELLLKCRTVFIKAEGGVA